MSKAETEKDQGGGDSDAGVAPVRVVVVDDEPAAREVVVTMLAEFRDVRVVGEASNGREAVTMIRSLKPDLVFLDIQMPDEDGFRVLERLGDEVPRGVVFVTAHDEHAIRAFDVHALDYLLKPFGRPRFRAAAGRALERLKEMDALTLTRTLSSMADDRRAGQSPAGELDIITSPAGSPPAPLPARIGVRTGSKVAVIDVASIDWVEALGDYARVHVAKSAHVVSQRMHALEQVLEAGGFVRIHRSLIVNLKRVKELHRESDGSGSVVLDSGVRLRVARGRWQALLDGLGMPEF